MKTWTTHHPCPYDGSYTSEDLEPCYRCSRSPSGQCSFHAECDDDVAVTYDCGNGPDDFYQVADELVCGKGHKVPAGIAESWVDRDMARYADELFDKYDEARESLYDRKGDR